MTETYHGKPCNVCGGTLRIKSGRHCVHRGRKDHLEARGMLDRDRARRRVENMTPERLEQAHARGLRAQRKYAGTVKGMQTRLRENHKRRLVRNEQENTNGSRAATQV